MQYEYDTPLELWADAKLIVSNCLEFNQEEGAEIRRVRVRRE